MKKAVLFLITVSLCLSFYTHYADTDDARFSALLRAEYGEASAVTILHSDVVYELDSAEFCRALARLSKEFSVNVFRTQVRYVNEEPFVTKYVMLCQPSRYFDNIPLRGGRYLSSEETYASDFFLSTDDTGDPNQVGVIRDFGQNDHLTVAPLPSSFENMLISGAYSIQSSGPQDAQKFIDALQTMYDLEIEQGQESSQPNSNGDAALANRFLQTLSLVLLIYFFFNNAKKVGVLKLQGASCVMIWWNMIGKAIAGVYAFLLALFACLSLCLGDMSADFALSTALSLTLDFVPIWIACALSTLFLCGFKIGDMLKNKRNTRLITLVNYALLVVFSTVTVSALSTAIASGAQAQNKRAALSNWTQASDYGLFHPIFIDDQDSYREGYIPSLRMEFYDLYPTLNGMGAIFVDAGSYQEVEVSKETGRRLESPLSEEERIAHFSMCVNPNYLSAFPVLDVSGEAVRVDERESDWILLIPETYKDREAQILSAHAQDRAQIMEYSSKIYAADLSKWPDGRQPLRVIWLKSGQRVFSFDPFVNPTDGNTLEDPIIEVLTEGNRLVGDVRLTYGSADDPMKIKLLGRDAQTTYERLLPVLKALKIDDNVLGVKTVHDSILEEIFYLNRQIARSASVSALLALCTVWVIVQNTIIHFNKRQRRIAAQKLFGAGFSRNYAAYLWANGALIALQWLIVGCRALFMRVYVGSETLCALALLSLSVFAIVTASLAIADRKGIAKILKGGYQ